MFHQIHLKFFNNIDKAILILFYFWRLNKKNSKIKYIMKKQLLILALLVSFGAKAQISGWIQQNVPYGYEGYINCLSVVDSNVVWGNTWDATLTSPYTKDVVRTIDGGNTWSIGSVTAPATWNIANIYGIDANNAFVSMFNASAAGGRVYRTTDGGATWTQVGTNMFTAATSFADVVYFWDLNNGMAMGDPIGNPLKYEIWLTSDNGTTWTQVPPANLPTLTNAAEYGITNLYSHAQGHVWFATTYGDVYHSGDGGNNWTKAATGLPAYNLAGGGRQDITDVAFTDSLNGLAIQVNATTSVVTVAQTSDGGATWSIITPSGAFFPGDVCGVPGLAGGYISAGSSTIAGFGSGISTDYGLTWTGIDANVSHTSVDFASPTAGWSGEYITAASPGGAYKYYIVTPVACTDPTVTAGTASGSDSIVCAGDTLTVTSVNSVAPTTGPYAGSSYIITTADVTGTADPLNEPSLVAAYGFVFPGLSTNVAQLINDGTFIGTTLPYGVYYWTPVVFGNATASTNPPQFLFDLVLDITCTQTGNSVAANILAPGDPLCIISTQNINAENIAVYAYMKDETTIDLQINSSKHEKANVQIYDLMGKMVYSNSMYVSKGTNHEYITVPSLSAGTYIIKAEAGSAKAVNKLVKL